MTFRLPSYRSRMRARFVQTRPLAVSAALHAVALSALLLTARNGDGRLADDSPARIEILLSTATALPVSLLEPPYPDPIAIAPHASVEQGSGGQHQPGARRPARVLGQLRLASLTSTASATATGQDTSMLATGALIETAPPVMMEAPTVADAPLPLPSPREAARGAGEGSGERPLAADDFVDVAGSGAHDGSGQGFLDGAGSGRESRNRRRRPLELFGRVIGGGIPADAPVVRDRPFITLKESTALRTHDLFPRLPAAAWTERHPYTVAIDLCVSDEGKVTETKLLSNQSPRFDALVMNAVTGWRYRTRLVNGQPRPFCHQVIIRYDIP